MHAEQNAYQNRWESRSSVRTRPRKPIDFSKTGYFFPPNKQPLLLLPEIQALDEQAKSEILVLSFYKYLHDIMNLEIKLIHLACQHVIDDSVQLTYPEMFRLNAYTIMIDEYYHVYLGQDMLIQLQSAFPQLKPLAYPVSDAIKAIQILKQRLPTEDAPLVDILGVSIFETTLIRELVEFFNAPEVHPSVRYYVNDHMNDEARHHGFFYDLLVYTWTHMSAAQQNRIGIQLADFVKLYLNISADMEYNCSLLNTFVHHEEKSQQLIQKIYHGFEISPDMPIVKNVLSVLNKTGIMEHHLVKQGFINHQLYIEP